MACIEMEECILNTPFHEFATSFLPLYAGPEIKIRIGSASHEYTLPKDLLCTQVPYFKGMFKKEQFKEGIELSATLPEEDGVVSPRSFEMLLQWVFHKRIVLGDLPPTEAIDAIIEFARLADMYNIVGLESSMANNLRQIILTDKTIQNSVFAKPPDQNTYYLTSEHIRAGVLLPEGHAVRKVLASAAVKGYLLRDRRQFFQDIQSLPDFAVDVLGEVGLALQSLETEKRGMSFVDPFGGRRINLAG
ncbi:hypothetical protein BJ875DRAFT_485449 [Amylocarpus encephaloides]|uniref:BTB domain-containing protein n=1 Tax=Amylocarpus encephaloides TaxID=45428 RepID=A0A9P8C402_9HELO|nr:hypothetical protein BJ875DRAFT_485449 [Amylocarpus encephaloides]